MAGSGATPYLAAPLAHARSTSDRPPLQHPPRRGGATSDRLVESVVGSDCGATTLARRQPSGQGPPSRIRALSAQGWSPSSPQASAPFGGASTWCGQPSHGANSAAAAAEVAKD